MVEGRNVHRVVVQFRHQSVCVRPHGLYCGAVEQFVLDTTWGLIRRALGEDACVWVHKVRLVDVKADVALVAYRRGPYVHGIMKQSEQGLPRCRRYEHGLECGC